MSGLEKQKIWNEVLASLKVSVSQAAYSTWISQTHLISLRKTDKTRYLAEIGCQTSFVKQNIESRYAGLTQDVLIKTIGSPCELTFIVKAKENTAKSVDSFTPLFDQTSSSEKLIEQAAKAGLRANFTFEKFAVSGSNQFAHAAAEAVASSPGDSYNPLFIWGGVGVGKTHLMHAVGYRLLLNKNNPRIVACTGETFTNDIVEGIRQKSTQRVREKYRKLDLLLVDDIQFIAGKESVQEEFFHTYNALTSSGGQIIMTADQPPEKITKLEDRLLSRFQAGLATDIASPDFELRCAIIEIKTKEKGINLDTESVHLIAGNYDSAREINGFLMQAASRARMENVEISIDFVKNLISKGKGIQETINKRTTPDKVIEKICERFSIGKRALMGKGRSKPVVYPRQIAMYILRTDLKLPFEEVGRLIGGRDHTTVMHNVDKISSLAGSDVDTREDISGIRAVL